MLGSSSTPPTHERKAGRASNQKMSAQLCKIIPRSGGLHPAKLCKAALHSQRLHDREVLATLRISMDNARLLTLPDISEAFKKPADMLLLLDDGVAIPCHSQLLSMHSAVFCNMLADLSSQSDEIVKVPLADFTEAQCSAVLAYL